ncbi:MAG: hypothetical protein GC178_07035 [Flavobacteriales bacterium]|nr:hypothetical protein [Flavobacteriales bacterium]
MSKAIDFFRNLFTIDRKKAQLEMVVDNLKSIVNRHSLESLQRVEIVYRNHDLTSPILESIETFVNQFTDLNGKATFRQGDHLQVRKVVWSNYPTTYQITAIDVTYDRHEYQFEITGSKPPWSPEHTDKATDPFGNFQSIVEYDRGEVFIFDNNYAVIGREHLTDRQIKQISKK